MRNLLRPQILMMFGMFVLMSCGGDDPDMPDMTTEDPCVGVKCSTENISNNKCVSGSCQGACNSGFADCNKNKQKDGCEVATGTDPKNCGGCGKVCSTNHVTNPTCVGGVCVGTCDPGWTDCNGNKQKDGCETAATSTALDCGGCGIACSGQNITTPMCSNAVCTGQCDPGFLDCDNDKLLNGCESSPGTDVKNCGGCGNVCSNNHIATPSCAASKCGGACDSGFADCDNNKLLNGCESPVSSDPNNCGGCGIKCSNTNITTPTCAASACNGQCNTGFADCNSSKQADGCETPVSSDPNNCGGCSKVCSNKNISSPTCANSLCNGTCNTGYGDCDNDKQSNGCESALGSDFNNCGGCGMKCSNNNIAMPTCDGSGKCSGACNTNFGDCNNNKLTDGCESSLLADPKNCGLCGAICSNVNIATPTCNAGVCDGACSAGFAACLNNKRDFGCETNIGTDPYNCGGCSGTGTAFQCSMNHINVPACAAGKCTGACNTGYGDCNNNKLTDGCETFLYLNQNNCGACGVVCPAGKTCSAVGVCQ